MSVTVVIPKETTAGEDRVAMVPVVADKLSKLGVKIKIQQDLGSSIYVADSAFKEVEAVKTAQELYAAGDIVLKIMAPTDEEINQMKEGAILVCLLYAHNRPEILKKLCAKKITCFALEMIPRTVSKAQSMDVLSSQATIMGYEAVLIAANCAKFFFPMLSTAAGTMRPAKVLIIGAGVAGLQAIATAKRLGARVEAYDVRPETKEQVASLGAMFVDTGVEAAGAGGYARELTAEEKQKQQAVLEEHIANSDIVITTAGVPGRPAPKIISEVMVEKMKPGSIIVDIMAEQGGNCVLAKPGENVEHKGVTIVGTKDIASSLAVNASEMFARNILSFITPMFKEGELSLDWEDEVLSSSVATRDGSVVHEALKKLEGVTHGN
jgi:NAD(P) transhydrogenase subunit alpha